jgi:hypothetical protein
MDAFLELMTHHPTWNNWYIFDAPLYMNHIVIADQLHLKLHTSRANNADW